MWSNPVMSLPLSDVMRSDIALPLHHVFRIYTVGCFLRAWANPANHHELEEVFDNPAQARHAATTCANWIGAKASLTLLPETELGWWLRDEDRRVAA